MLSTMLPPLTRSSVVNSVVVPQPSRTASPFSLSSLPPLSISLSSTCVYVSPWMCVCFLWVSFSWDLRPLVAPGPYAWLPTWELLNWFCTGLERVQHSLGHCWIVFTHAVLQTKLLALSRVYSPWACVTHFRLALPRCQHLWEKAVETDCFRKTWSMRETRFDYSRNTANCC